MADLKSPFFWLTVFFAGILVCAWFFDKAAKQINLPAIEEPEPPSQSEFAKFKKFMLFAPLVFGVLYLLYYTNFTIALIVLMCGSLYYWREAHRNRVLPLVAAGLSRPQARLLTFIQLLWIGPLTIALLVFVWGKYSAP